MDQPLTTVSAATNQAASTATNQTSPFERARATLRSRRGAAVGARRDRARSVRDVRIPAAGGRAAPYLLYRELELADSSAIVDRRKALGVTFLQGDGRAILVPADRARRLHMTPAAEGLPRDGTRGDEIFDQQSALGTIDFLANVRLRRALKGELARTIASLTDVRAARVHLVLPRRELFRRQQIERSASVKLAHVPRGTHRALPGAGRPAPGRCGGARAVARAHQADPPPARCSPRGASSASQSRTWSKTAWRVAR